MAETAKAMKGVEAIMRGESVNAVSTGAVKQVAPDAPYALDGSESMMMQQDPRSRTKVPQDGELPAEHDARSDKGAKEQKKGDAFSDKDISEHLEKDKSIKAYLANNLKSAQNAVKVFSSRGASKHRKKGKQGGEGKEDESNYA